VKSVQHVTDFSRLVCVASVKCELDETYGFATYTNLKISVKLG
jgi:hypothetical protein